MKTKKKYSSMRREADFKDIDRQLLEGFECSQFNSDNKKFLSMIREQTNSAINNKKYWSNKSEVKMSPII
tara:strand:+ start:511 stop:720 length:210 start_codon:yes stop_codon:yes gene_type:complete